MPMLGEILLAAKAVTESELDSALEYHVLHGVKLGTCLVEMGFVDDNILAECLGKQTGYAFLTKDHLIAAGSQNLTVLAPAVIRKHRLIPVGVRGATLRIATDGHLTTHKLEELESFIGRKIEPVAVSGYAVDCFLEQIFGIPRPGRFLPRTAKAQPASAHQPDPERIDKKKTAPLIIDGVEWKTLGEESQGDESVSICDQILSAPFSHEVRPRTLADAAEQLSHASSRDDVAITVLDFISNFTGVSALVIVHGSNVRGWKAVSDNKSVPDFESFAAQLEKIPDLWQCVTQRKPFFGRCMTPETGQLMNILHWSGGVVSYFPIFLHKRVVAVLICEKSARLDTIDAAELCQKASYAIELLILRSKLLS